MKFPIYFADAESNYKDAEFVIFGVPYDKTCSFRSGARQGPKAIRQASWNFETFNYQSGIDLKDINFHDYGDIDVSNEIPTTMVKKVKDFSTKLLRDKKFPICLGGEHSITPGVIGAFPKDISIVCLDAHMDFRQKYEGDKNNHACVNRRISDYIDVENIAVLGVRSAEKEEFEDAKKQGLFFIDSYNITENGIKNVIDETLKHLKNESIYLSLDIDVIDPAFAPGTSNPEPFGLSHFDILDNIERFSSRLVGFDVVEVCPAYDNGQTAILAAKIVRLVIEKVWAKKQG
jgi:agmatinase